MTQHKHDSPDAIARYREVMAWFLKSTLSLMAQLVGRETSFTEDINETRAEIERDPDLACRTHALFMIRKARLHVVAVLAANQDNNLHSLAVQMRPALECAGQVVSVFRNVFVASDPVAVDQYLTSDYIQTMQRLSRGQWNLNHFLERSANAHPMVQSPKPRRLLHTDKVQALEGGPACYAYLSRFHHPSLDMLRGPSAFGGVSSNDSPLDRLAFAINLDYLAHQMLVMLVHATLPGQLEPATDPLLNAALSGLKKKQAATRQYAVPPAAILPNDELSAQE